MQCTLPDNMSHFADELILRVRTFSNISFSSQPLRPLPLDVLRYHIIPLLGPASLIACSMSCSWFAKFVLSRAPPCQTNCQRILSDIFHNGFVELFQWSQKTLKFPKLSLMDDDDRHELFSLAAEVSRLGGKNFLHLLWYRLC